MNLNPVKGIQSGLAFLGIGGLYLYNYPLMVRKARIEGPYSSNADLKINALITSTVTEVKFHFKPPIGVIKPGKAER